MIVDVCFAILTNAPHNMITLLKGYGDKATYINNFFIFAVFKYHFYHKSTLLLKFVYF